MTASRAVGGKKLLEDVKEKLGAQAQGQKVHEAGEFFELRENIAPYKADFDNKNGDIGAQAPMLGIFNNIIQQVSLV